MSERNTYRFRNSKNHWAIGPHPKFWVGQKVARVYDIRNYQHVIEELATVTELPKPGSSNLKVKVIGGPRDGEEAVWSATECKPVRWVVSDNRRRLRAVANEWKDTLACMDKDGFPKHEGEE